jgi:hypothetical protein
MTLEAQWMASLAYCRNKLDIEKARVGMPAMLEELEFRERFAQDFLVSGLATHFGSRHLSISHLPLLSGDV